MLVASAAGRIRNRNMSEEGDAQAPPASKVGRGLPLSGGRDALPLLTLDSRDYEVADFWTKVLEVVRVREPELLEAVQVVRLKEAILAYMDTGARKLFRNDDTWSKAGNQEELREALFKNYPSACDVKIGSLKALEQIIRHFSAHPLSLDNADTAMCYCRQFKAEAQDLISRPNCKVTGYQLASMFERPFETRTRESIHMTMNLNKTFREAQRARERPAGVAIPPANPDAT
jgi:hypothetical protein